MQALSERFDGFEEAVAGIVGRHGTDAGKRVADILGKLDPEDLDALKVAGRLDQMADGIANKGWDAGTVQRFATLARGGLPPGLVGAAMAARVDVVPGRLTNYVPPAGSPRSPGHVRSAHGFKSVNDPIILDIRNAPDRIYVGVNENGNQVVIFWKDETIVITDAANSNSVITAYGKNAPGLPNNPSRPRSDKWAGDPDYFAVED